MTETPTLSPLHLAASLMPVWLKNVNYSVSLKCRQTADLCPNWTLTSPGTAAQTATDRKLHFNLMMWTVFRCVQRHKTCRKTAIPPLVRCQLWENLLRRRFSATPSVEEGGKQDVSTGFQTSWLQMTVKLRFLVCISIFKRGFFSSLYLLFRLLQNFNVQ